MHIYKEKIMTEIKINRIEKYIDKCLCSYNFETDADYENFIKTEDYSNI
ncbi:hypothetical protein BACFRA24663_17220 [Bacteroides fragilis]